MDWTPLAVSLQAATAATVLATIGGVGLGYLLAKGRFPGRGVIEAVASLPIALPPTVLGYYLLTRLGGPGIVRDLSVALFGHPLVFTFPGIVIAATIEAFPYCLRAARAAIAGADPHLEESARAIGLREHRVALQVTLPLARRGIVAGVAMAFGRALGDYGATVLVSGKLPGTTTMPIAVYDAVFDARPHTAQTLALVQTAVAVMILVAVGRLGKVRV